MAEPILWRGELGVQVASRNPVTNEPLHRIVYHSHELVLAGQEAALKPPLDNDTKPKKRFWMLRYLSRWRC